MLTVVDIEYIRAIHGQAEEGAWDSRVEAGADARSGSGRGCAGRLG